MNNKGQALIEFVLILPIFMFLIFLVYDFGMIFNSKNRLENSSSDIIALYKNGKTLDDIRNKYASLEIDVSNDSECYEFIIQDKVKLITPGLNRVFGNPYKISVVRYIPYE